MALGTYDRLVELYMIARRGSLWWLERMALGTYDRLVELAGCTL